MLSGDTRTERDLLGAGEPDDRDGGLGVLAVAVAELAVGVVAPADGRAVFLDCYARMTEAEDFEATPLLEYRGDADRVALTTLHQSKGMSFDVVFVADGDTVRVVYRGAREWVRLLRIDTPERDEEGYEEAREALSRMVDGRDVELVFETPGVAALHLYSRHVHVGFVLLVVDGNGAIIVTVFNGSNLQ